MRELVLAGFGIAILVALVLVGFRALDGTGPAQADDVALIFGAELDGAQQVPPVVTDTTGRAQIKVNKAQTEARFALQVRDGTGITQAHIHCAPAGQNGPVVAFLFGFVAGGVDVNGNLANGTLTNSDILGTDCGTGTISTIADLTQAMLDRNTYVDVHSLRHPAGNALGQLRHMGQLNR